MSWRDSTQEQRNRLAHALFEQIRVGNDKIKGVTPQIEFTPLLVLSHLTQLAQIEKESNTLDTSIGGV